MAEPATDDGHTLTLAELQAAWPMIPDICWLFDPSKTDGRHAIQVAIEKGMSPREVRDAYVVNISVLGCRTPKQERVREQLQTEDAVLFIAGLMGAV